MDELADLLNATTHNGDPESIQAATDDVGAWIATYLAENGYNPHIQSLMIKQMILTAFPSITKEKEYTKENIRERILRTNRILNEYMAITDRRKYNFKKLLGNGTAPVYFS